MFLISAPVTTIKLYSLPTVFLICRHLQTLVKLSKMLRASSFVVTYCLENVISDSLF